MTIKQLELMPCANPEFEKPVLVDEERVELFKRRMLEWSNPVEYVNNMYGCHPGDNGSDYFHSVFYVGQDKK
jgi:hypothetical protein